jgi:hypothetical protein
MKTGDIDGKCFECFENIRRLGLSVTCGDYPTRCDNYKKIRDIILERNKKHEAPISHIDYDGV